jgi:two-component system NtrC family sensor kinase
MTLLWLSHWLAVLVSISLGGLVWLNNPRRLVNQCFLTLSLLLALWLIMVGGGVLSGKASIVEIIVRYSTTLAALIPLVFNLLRVAMTGRAQSWLQALRLNAWGLAAAILTGVLCFSPWMVVGVRVPEADSPTPFLEPVYGPGIHAYAAYMTITLLLLVYRYARDARLFHGIQRLELQFTMLGGGIGIFFGVCVAVLIPIATSSSQSVQLVPFCVIFLDGLTAYGIATRRILEVAGVVRRATAYALLSAYLTLIYTAIWWISQGLLDNIVHHNDFVAHLLAAMAAAFSLAPANGLLQGFANRLFLNMRTVDPADILQRANRILTSVASRDDMLLQFASLLSATFGTDRMLIVLNENGRWRTRYPKGGITAPLLTSDHALVQALENGQPPLVADVLVRFRSGPAERAVAQGLQQLQSAIAIGIHAPNGLRGIICMGARLSGRIYDWEDQRTLQLLANQLAVGLENTELYTRLQDSAIYNDILLDHLVSGVIAAGHDQRITICNREAKRILGMEYGTILQQPIDLLPPALVQAFRQAFATGQGQRDLELQLYTPRHEIIPVRVGTAMFHSHTGKALGVLLVFSDLTALRKLEGQVRRTDRLASLGTLSAGMAHEIKNPLVTLKTFTQLLPERYEDPDFRTTFSNLVGEEVKRIDSIVNQLLRFARPAKPSLMPTHVHEVVDNTLRLVQQQLKHKNIGLKKDFQVSHDLIQGDGNLLVQAFLNFFLNAIDAMESGGQLSVTTTLIEFEGSQPTFLGVPSAETRLRLSIRDSGKGIRPDDLPHVFDPFFTTKSSGTGLGLSVSHGIIHEHHAVIDVESEVGQGTVFHVTFPILREEVSA